MKQFSKVWFGVLTSIALLSVVLGTTPSCTPTSLCPSDELTEIASCTTNGTVLWRRFKNGMRQSFFSCTSKQILLSSNNIISNQPHVINCRNSNSKIKAITRVILLPPVDNTYTSTLSVTPSPEMDGDIVQCLLRIDHIKSDVLVRRCQLDIVVPPASPRCGRNLITNEDIMVNTQSQTASVTIRWREPSEAGITGYSINVNPLPSVFPTECGGTTNPCMVSPDVRELQFQLVLNTTYIVSISAIDQCNQTGPPRNYNIDIRLQVPAAVQPDGNISEAVNVVYDSSGTLTSITVAWRPVKGDHVIVSGCGGTLLANDPTHYRVTVIGGSTSMVNQTTLPPCTTDCSYTYSPPDNSPSDQYRVMVAAENVFGLGSEFMTQEILNTNDILKVAYPKFVNLSISPGSPSVNITCQFLPLFNGPHTCTLHYGTSPTNLESTTGPGVVFMLNDLFKNEEYYYKATAKHQNFTISVRGSFVACSPPPPPPEGCTVEVDGPVATYSCSDMYELVGESTIMCQNGTGWGTSRVTVKESPLPVSVSTTDMEADSFDTSESPQSVTTTDMEATNTSESSQMGMTTEPNLTTVTVSNSANSEFSTSPLTTEMNKNVENGSSSVTIIIGIIIGVVVLAALMSVMIVILFCLKFRKKQKDNSMQYGVKNNCYQLTSDGLSSQPHDGPDTGTSDDSYGCMYSMVDLPKKNENFEENLPTYQDPQTIKHQSAPDTGELYAIAEKPNKSSNDEVMESSEHPTEKEIEQMYSVPDKSKKAKKEANKVIVEHQAGPDTGELYAVIDVKKKHSKNNKTNASTDDGSPESQHIDKSDIIFPETNDEVIEV